MKIRIWTTMSYIDIETREPIDKDEIAKQLDLGNVVSIKTIEDTEIYLNNVNIVAIEIQNTPPINLK